MSLYCVSVVGTDEEDILKTKNFGRKSLSEIKETLAQLGLGGYEIVKIGPRRGDGADMAMLELIGTEFKKKEKKKRLKEKFKEAKAKK